MMMDIGGPETSYVSGGSRRGSVDRARPRELSVAVPARGEARSDPFYLVCTNARRDACCALLGRPLTAALSRMKCPEGPRRPLM